MFSLILGLSAIMSTGNSVPKYQEGILQLNNYKRNFPLGFCVSKAEGLRRVEMTQGQMKNIRKEAG